MRRNLGRRTVLAVAGAALVSPAIRAQAQTAGAALVIGNSKYQWEAPLPNVRRDAPDMAKQFQAMGFKTEFVQDAGRDSLRQAVDKFQAAARSSNVAAFYFAGHGATWERETYLVPVDADLSSPSAVQTTLLPVPDIGKAMDGATNLLVILDNCRNNPADGWRQLQAQRDAISRVPVTRHPNTLTIYSTAAGRVALDGPAGQNSPFAASVLRQLAAPSVDLHTLAGRLRRDLLIATEGRQLVWDINTYTQPVVIKGARGAAPAAAGDPARVVELAGAYAYAREIGSPLPEGLVAYRAPAGSRYARMIGSYKFTEHNPLGKTPAILIVMSVEDGKSAEAIVSAVGERGPYWRIVTGKVSGDKLEWVPRAASGKRVISWKDANSGGVDLHPPPDRNVMITTSSMTRLDG